MKTFKIMTISATLFFMLGFSGLYADTSDTNHQTDSLRPSETGPMTYKEVPSHVSRATFPDANAQKCATDSTVVEMPDGFGIIFTDHGVKFENGVSIQDRFQHACNTTKG